MATNFGNIKSSVELFGDGRTFGVSDHALWANHLRKDVAMDSNIAGFNGLYFLYKEATVQNGSVVSQAKYAIPDDFIGHLFVFYDNTLLTEIPKKQLSVTQQNPSDGTPKWVHTLGLEFELVPAADTAAKEIKLLYCGLPSDIPSSANNDYTDYFLNHWPNLHIFGMAEQAWLYMGNTTKAQLYANKTAEQKANLTIHNRMHWFKNARLRFFNWDEYTDYKTTLFPQLED
jgi:hypothetical protein